MVEVVKHIAGEPVKIEVDSLDDLCSRGHDRWVGNIPLRSVGLGRFEYMDDTIKAFGEYKVMNKSAFGLSVDVFVFHSAIKPYGKSSVSFHLPRELSARLPGDKYNSIWCVQIYGFSEEDIGPSYTYQKFMRRVGAYDCISIPQTLAAKLEQRVWTIVIARTRLPIPEQYDGFIYPAEFPVGDMFGFRDFIKTVKQ